MNELPSPFATTQVESGIVVPAAIFPSINTALSVYLNSNGTCKHIINDFGTQTSRADPGGGGGVKYYCRGQTPPPPTPPPPPPPPSPGFSCSKGNWTCLPTAPGEFPTVQACEAACATPAPAGWSPNTCPGAATPVIYSKKGAAVVGTQLLFTPGLDLCRDCLPRCFEMGMKGCVAVTSNATGCAFFSAIQAIAQAGPTTVSDVLAGHIPKVH